EQGQIYTCISQSVKPQLANVVTIIHSHLIFIRTGLVICPSTDKTTSRSPRPVRLRGNRMFASSSPAKSGCAPAKDVSAAIPPTVVDTALSELRNRNPEPKATR